MKMQNYFLRVTTANAFGPDGENIGARMRAAGIQCVAISKEARTAKCFLVT